MSERQVTTPLAVPRCEDDRDGFALNVLNPIKAVPEVWASAIATQLDFSEVTHDVELYGLCASCSRA